MKRSFAAAIGISALMTATLLPGAAAARAPERFGRFDAGEHTATTGNLLSNRDPNRMVMLFVELGGKPVASYMGAALNAGTEMSEAAKTDIRRPLATAQAALKTRLRALGASIEGSYTDVLNAVRVRVPASQMAGISALPGVSRVTVAQKLYRDNTNTVPFVGADTTWDQTGFTGSGVSIAVIDTGINYYHRDFAGPAGWAADDGLDRSDGNFPTAKVVSGYDFAGDAYDPDSSDPAEYIPSPDNDPLDCKAKDAPDVQHGTHVSGTAAGTGVLSNGATYTGPYDAATLSTHDFRIGPGTAPQASLMAFRVFGCGGSTFLVVDAIEMAVRRGADVINMSLGSPYGNPDSADAVAVDNASIAGTTVVMSAGNSGPAPYITGSPGVATRGISVAAVDADPSFPSVTIDMPTGADITGINANGETGDLPVTGTLNHFEDNPATPFDGNDEGVGDESLGCNPQDYTFNAFAGGQIAVVHRGYCARVQRAIEGDAQGAASVIMVNNSAGFPPYEGPIAGVDIPFVGVSITEDARFTTDDGGSATISEGSELANPSYRHTASFTSGGPRRLDSMIKPDVAAPGVGVFSADGGTVTQGKSLSGTSMASPATAGVVALITQAHPTWTPEAIKAALVGTALPAWVSPYETRMSGAGVVNPRRAVDTVAYAVTDPGVSSLTFRDREIGFGPTGSLAFRTKRPLTLVNKSGSAITYDLTNSFSTPDLGFNVTISPSSITVPAGSRRTVDVRLTLSEADAAALPDAAPFHGPGLAADDFGQLYTSLTNAAGAIIADPRTSGPGLYNIRVPWLVAPRGLSEVTPRHKTENTAVTGGWTSSINVKNKGVHAGIADFYAWGLLDDNDALVEGDLRAAGVQSIDSSVCDSSADPSDRCIVFAINTWNQSNNASEVELDTLIDTDNDGSPDYLVAGVDAGLVLGAFDGLYLSVIVDLSAGVTNLYLATAPNNSGTVLLPVLASDLGLTGDGRFDYLVESFGIAGTFDVMTSGLQSSNASPFARFWAYGNPISNGDFILLAPGASADVPLAVSEARYGPRRYGEKGWMIVSFEDRTQHGLNGQGQADLIPVGATQEHP